MPNRQEVAARARRLIEARGSPNKSQITGEVTSHDYRLGKFYMRVRTETTELYVNNMSDALGTTIFSQREVDSTGAWHDFACEQELLSALRQAMILDELANL